MRGSLNISPPWSRPSPRPQLLIPALLTIVAALVLVAVARWLSYSDPYVAFALGSAFIFYSRLGVAVKEWVAWAASLIVFGEIVHFPPNGDPILWIAMLCAILGFGSFVMLCLRSIWCEEPYNSTAMASLAPVTLLVLYILSAQHALNLATWLRPRTLDLYLFSFDGSLGFQPSFWVARLLNQYPPLRFASLLSYVSLPLAMGAAYAASVDPHAKKPSLFMLKLFVLAGLLGWCLYLFFPATGPAYAFQGDFPNHALSPAELKQLVLEPISLPQSIPRNAIPSLHMAWAILIAWNASRLGHLAQSAVVGYLILTVLATLGTGEHYLIDLVVAFPFALAVQSLGAASESASREYPWKLGLAIGFALIGIWFVSLRYAGELFRTSPAIPWLAISATIATVELVRRKLTIAPPVPFSKLEVR